MLHHVVNGMQPNIRQYYQLEELWGEKPVRLKFGTAKPFVAAPSSDTLPVAPGKAAKPAPNLKRSSAAKKGVEEAFPSKKQVRKIQDAKAPAASRKS